MSCPECFKGAIHDHAEPKGKIEMLYGYSSYVATPPPSSTSKSAILFLTDAFGLNLLNNKLMADRFAAETGCKVVVPDIIPGGGATVNAINFMETVTAPVAYTDILGQLHRIWAGLRTAFVFIPFMIRAGGEKAYPAELNFARDMKKNLPPGGKLGVAGYCWGGYGSTKLCAETAEEGGSTPLIDAQFTAHPSKITTDMIIAAVTNKVPYSMAIGDNDMVLALKDVLAIEAALEEKFGKPEENNYEVKVYKGCKHGFAMRALPNNKVAIDAAEDAAKQAIDWYNKYLN
jgi:dienelactone hydrolase